MRIGILTGGGGRPWPEPVHQGRGQSGRRRWSPSPRHQEGMGRTPPHEPDDPESIAENTINLEPATVRTVDRTGGTFLHTSRTNPSNVRASDVPAFLADEAAGDEPRDLTRHIVHVVDSLGIDALIAIGGDDTLSYGLRLHNEGLPVVAIPKTMDNDVHGTDYCIGSRRPSPGVSNSSTVSARAPGRMSGSQ